MKTDIQAIKIGKTINISINGKLKQKICKDDNEAKEIYNKILEYKNNPSDDVLNKINILVNDVARVVLKSGLECDVISGDIYLAGFNTPIPEELVDIIKHYHEEGYPMEAILNFWKLLMLNPDENVRKNLFTFLQKYDYVITDEGYFITYKVVCDNIMYKTINEYYDKVKSWKSSPRKYVIYIDHNDDDELRITKKQIADNWSSEERNITIMGTLEDVKNEFQYPYTDKHSKTMNIRLGEVVQMDRENCNASPEHCSYGLHVGATSYVNWFHSKGDTVMACYINPANVVNIPTSDSTKIRVTEYFPFTFVNYNDDTKSIEPFEQQYYQSDYIEYEQEELKRLYDKAIQNQQPIPNAIEASQETRPIAELIKIIEDRMINV